MSAEIETLKKVTSIMEAKFEAVNKQFHELKAENDKLEEKVANSTAVSEQKQLVENINSSITELQEEIKELKRKQSFAPQLEGEKADKKATDAFFKALKSGMSILDEAEAECYLAEAQKSAEHYLGTKKSVAEIKGMMAGQETTGGLFVPQPFEMRILRLAEDEISLYRLAEKQTTGTSSYKRPAQLEEAECLWAGETESRKETRGPGYGDIKIDVHTLTASPKITQELLEDAGINLESEIMTSLGRAYPQAFGRAFVTGTGIGQPRGILAHPMFNQKNKKDSPWQQVGFLPTGAAGAFKDSDVLIEAVTALRKTYRMGGAVWMMNSMSEAKVRLLKDSDGNYLWQPGLQDGTPPKLLGYGVEIEENMPDFTADAFPIAFINPSRAYLVANRRGMKMLRDPYSDTPNVIFKTDMRLGGDIQNFEALKLIKASA